MRDMDTDEFISTAIDTGSDKGIEALDVNQRLVYLVSEAEVYCDKDGIPSFLDRYFPQLEEAAAAFAAIGAAEIAAGLRTIAASTKQQDLQFLDYDNDQLLSHVNKLITDRAGYDYETIRRAVERRLAMRSP
jgi:hypothetical protein